MNHTDQTPSFNLKVVVRETGVKPDALRAWERRYGLPQPQRTSGGHRLYSQRDIDTLKWLTARQDEGLSISRAVKLWRQIEAEGKDPLQASPLQADVSSVAEIPAPISNLSVDSNIAQLRNTWLAACLAFDEQKAENILAQAFAMYPPEVVCIELLQKGLSEIGQKWYQGEAIVQQEHFAASLAMRRLDALIAAAPPPTQSEHILVGCPPEEEHDLIILMLTLFLKRRGWQWLNR